MENIRHMHTHAYTFTYIYTHSYTFIHIQIHAFQGFRVAKTPRMPYVYRLFSSKEPYNLWLICGKRPTTWGILCIFATLYHLRMKVDPFMWDIPHPCETWLIHWKHVSSMWDMTHAYSYTFRSIASRTRSRVWGMTHSCETWLIHVRRVSSMWDMSHSCKTWPILFHMEWLRLVGSIEW